MTKEQLDGVAHGIAFDSCVTALESSLTTVAETSETSEEFAEWLDLEGCDAFAREDVELVLVYLRERGLIETHATNPNWIQIREESEATR